MNVQRIFVAALVLCLGLVLGIGFLEIALRLNTGLLLKGMDTPLPVASPLDEQEYAVFSSDADLFFWQSDLMEPVQSAMDRQEAEVHYYTDEFGFPNQAPLSPEVDVVVLGRSYSMGAQASHPWTRRLAEWNSLRVLNLSQTGSGIDRKSEYLRAFGLPRKPRWVVLEILPIMDIFGYSKTSPWIMESIPLPLVQSIFRQFKNSPNNPPADNPIFPIELTIPGQTVDFSDFLYYLSSLTVDVDMIQASRDWAEYKQGLLLLTRQASDAGACVLLLYVPTKSDVYLPLAQNPKELTPALEFIHPWTLNSQLRLTQTGESEASAGEMQANADRLDSLVAALAQEAHVAWVNPGDAMRQAVLRGEEPFMYYDTHWSDSGHEIVAGEVDQALQSASCP